MVTKVRKASEGGNNNHYPYEKFFFVVFFSTLLQANEEFSKMKCMQSEHTNNQK